MDLWPAAGSRFSGDFWILAAAAFPEVLADSRGFLLGDFLAESLAICRMLFFEGSLKPFLRFARRNPSRIASRSPSRIARTFPRSCLNLRPAPAAFPEISGFRRGRRGTPPWRRKKESEEAFFRPEAESASGGAAGLDFRGILAFRPRGRRSGRPSRIARTFPRRNPRSLFRGKP